MTKKIEHGELEKLHEFFDVTKPKSNYQTYVSNILCDIFGADKYKVFEQFKDVLNNNIGKSLKDKFIKVLDINDEDDITKQIKEIRAKSDEELKRKIFKVIKEIDSQLFESKKQELNDIYINHLNPVGQLLDWLEGESEFVNSEYDNKNKSNFKSGFKGFATALFGFYQANTWLNNNKNDFLFCQLIAENTLFASREVFDLVKAGKLGADNLKKDLKDITVKGANEYGSWDYMAHARRVGKKKKNQLCTDAHNDEITNRLKNKKNKYNYCDINDMIIADDNTCANIYIKTAILVSYKNKFDGNPLFTLGTKDYFADYEACHVWDLPGDRRYYASIGNLVLVPRALAQLTDHCDAVKQLLRYEVWKRFGFKPDEEKKPKKPTFYKKIHWRDEYDGNIF